MDPRTFRAFQELARQEAGIFLRPGKAALVRARLARRVRELNVAGEEAYLEVLRGDRDEVTRFLDAISTSFTRFFREPDHFDLVAEAVAAARAAGQERFRFWCAGCASGEEPYTLAMVLAPLLAGCDWKILATDLSTPALARATAGVYSDDEIEPVPPLIRQRGLERAAPAPDGRPRWSVAAALRERISFARLNLAARPYPMRGPFDAVLCRNVMIYFDQDMRAGVVAEVERLLAPGGLLLVGHSETLSGSPTRLRSIRPSVYQQAGGDQ